MDDHKARDSMYNSNELIFLVRYSMDLTIVGQLTAVLFIAASGPLVIVLLAAQRGNL